MKKLAFAAVAAFVAAQPASAITINLFDLGGVQRGTAEYRNIRTAANFWERVLTSDTTINFNVSFGALSQYAVAEAALTVTGASVADVVTALDRSRSSRLDAQTVLPTTRSSTFPGGLAVDAIVSGPYPELTLDEPWVRPRILDNDASANNSSLLVPTATMKALGLQVDYNDLNNTGGLTPVDRANQIDGTIRFGNMFPYDYDAADGISQGYTDLLGVAIHEMGHALGFVSSVDYYEYYNGLPTRDLDLNGYAVSSTLDLFRYTAESASIGALDWAVGGNPYLSIDGGATAFGGNAFFATGASAGGTSASHWRAQVPGRGLLDPYAPTGSNGIVTNLDLAALDAMGYDVAYDVLGRPDLAFSTRYIASVGGNIAVPEPATWAMMIGGFGLVGGALRRRRALKTTVSFA